MSWTSWSISLWAQEELSPPPYARRFTCSTLRTLCTSQAGRVYLCPVWGSEISVCEELQMPGVRQESGFYSRSQQTLFLKYKTVCLETPRVVSFLLPLLSQILPYKNKTKEINKQTNKTVQLKHQGVWACIPTQFYWWTLVSELEHLHFSTRETLVTFHNKNTGDSEEWKHDRLILQMLGIHLDKRQKWLVC